MLELDNVADNDDRLTAFTKPWELLEGEERTLRLLTRKFALAEGAHLMAGACLNHAKALDEALYVDAEAAGFTFEQVAEAWLALSNLPEARGDAGANALASAGAQAAGEEVEEATEAA